MKTIILVGLVMLLPSSAFCEENPQNKADCKAAAGQWGPWGLLGTEECNRPTKDAGKACSDSKDCESICMTESELPHNTAVQGKCYGWSIARGTCLNHVLGGKSQGTLCID